MEIDANNLHNLVQRQMYEDPSGGNYNMRVMLQFFQMSSNTNMTEDERAAVFDLLHVIALKFASIWTINNRYEIREKELVAATEAKPIDRRKNEPVRIGSGQDLYIEWDMFLVQCKSVLDHMVVILHYTHGLNFSSLTTFGNVGQGIINVLKANVGAKPPAKKVAARLLIETIEKNQDWLRGMINARDRMNHFTSGGISPMNFGVASIIEKDGMQTLHVPRIAKDMTVKEYMTSTMDSILIFIERFMGQAMFARLPNHALQWKHSEDPKAFRWQMIPSAIMRHLMDSGQLDPAKIHRMDDLAK
jgi:hypothetical protein